MRNQSSSEILLNETKSKARLKKSRDLERTQPNQMSTLIDQKENIFQDLNIFNNEFVNFGRNSSQTELDRLQVYSQFYQPNK